jgi:hypothetical protein
MGCKDRQMSEDTAGALGSGLCGALQQRRHTSGQQFVRRLVSHLGHGFGSVPEDTDRRRQPSRLFRQVLAERQIYFGRNSGQHFEVMGLQQRKGMHALHNHLNTQVIANHLCFAIFSVSRHTPVIRMRNIVFLPTFRSPAERYLKLLAIY